MVSGQTLLLVMLRNSPTAPLIDTPLSMRFFNHRKMAISRSEYSR
jgi:hypothetical protein